MIVTRRELLKGAAALGVAGAMPQLAPGAAQAQTTQKKELIVAQGGDIARFDPHFSTSSNDIRWSFNLFDNLTSRHPDGKLYAGLATEWKLEGQSTYRFKLREGVKFHNGDPFTSADAKFSIERTYDPAAKTMVATALSTIDHIEAPDPFTLVIHTKKPDPLLPARLGFYGGQIVPKKYVESVGNDTFNAQQALKAIMIGGQGINKFTGGSNPEGHDGGADGTAGGEGTADGGSNPEGHDGGADGTA